MSWVGMKSSLEPVSPADKGPARSPEVSVGEAAGGAQVPSLWPGRPDRSAPPTGKAEDQRARPAPASSPRGLPGSAFAFPSLSSPEAEGIPSAWRLPEPAERGLLPWKLLRGRRASAHAPYLGQVSAAGSRAPVTPAGGLWRCQPACASARVPAPGRTDPEQRGRSPGAAASHGRRARRRGGSSANLRRSPSPSRRPRLAIGGQRRPARARGAVPAAGRGGAAGPRLRPWPAPRRASCSPLARRRSCPAARGRSGTRAALPSA